MDWGLQHSTWMDIAIVIVLLAGVITGLRQGMVRQLCSLLGFFFGTMIASQRYQELTGVLGFIGDPNWARVISFVVITMAVVVAASLVGSVIHRILSYMALGCVDWLGGGVLGGIETLFLVETFLILTYKYPILGVVKSIEESKIALQIIKLAPALLGLLPPEFDAVKQLIR